MHKDVNAARRVFHQSVVERTYIIGEFWARSERMTDDENDELTVQYEANVKDADYIGCGWRSESGSWFQRDSSIYVNSFKKFQLE